MKVAKIMLDNNLQTVLALKHIYTLLLVNQKIDLRIDMPVASHDNDDSMFEDDEAAAGSEEDGDGGLL